MDSPPSPSEAFLLRKPLPPASQCFPWRSPHFSARHTPPGARSPGGASAARRVAAPTCYGAAGSPLPFARVLEVMVRRRRARASGAGAGGGGGGSRYGGRQAGGRTPVNSQRRDTAVTSSSRHPFDREGQGDRGNVRTSDSSAENNRRNGGSGSSSSSSGSHSRSQIPSPRHCMSVDGAGKTTLANGLTADLAANGARAALSSRLEECRNQGASQQSQESQNLDSGAGSVRGQAGANERAEAHARVVEVESMGGRTHEVAQRGRAETAGGRAEDIIQRARLAEAQVDMAELQAQVVTAELQWIRSAVEKQEARVASVLAGLGALRQRVHRAQRSADGGMGGGAQRSGENAMREVQQVEADVASAEAWLWRVEAAAADARASLISLGGGAGELRALAEMGAAEGGTAGGFFEACCCDAGMAMGKDGGVMGVGCGGEVCGGLGGCMDLEGYGLGEVGLSTEEFALELHRRLEEVQKELVRKGEGHRVVMRKEERVAAEGKVAGEASRKLQPTRVEAEERRLEGAERVRVVVGEPAGCCGAVADGGTVTSSEQEKELLLEGHSKGERAVRSNEVELGREASFGAGDLRFWDRISSGSKLLVFGSGKERTDSAVGTSTVASEGEAVLPMKLGTGPLYSEKPSKPKFAMVEDQEEAKILRDAMEYLKKEVERAQRIAPALGAK